MTANTYWTFGYKGGEYSSYESALNAAVNEQFDYVYKDNWANSIDIYKVEKTKVHTLPSRSGR